MTVTLPITVKTIFVDMDDTLIVTHPIYDSAYKSFNTHMTTKHGVDAVEMRRVFEGLETAHLETMGFCRTRWPLSFEKTVRHFVADADHDFVAAMRDIAEAVFDTLAPVKNGIEEAISLLTTKFPVHIVTQGDDSVQQSRIAQLPFRDKLTGTHILPRKTPQAYSELLAKLNLGVDDVIMIGDSEKSDIIAANDAGLYAVWVKADSNAHFEQVPRQPHPRAFEAESLLSLARHWCA